MSDSKLPAEYLPLLRTLQIVVGALMGGVAVFSCIVVGLRMSGNNEGTDATLLSYVSVGLLVMVVAARAAVLSALATQGRQHIASGKWRDGSGVTGTKVWADLIEREGDRARLLALYQSRTVIGAAVLEVAGLFGCVAHLIEGSWIGVGVAVVTLGLMLVLQWPSSQAAQDWVTEQARRLEADR